MINDSNDQACYDIMSIVTNHKCQIAFSYTHAHQTLFPVVGLGKGRKRAAIWFHAREWNSVQSYSYKQLLRRLVLSVPFTSSTRDKLHLVAVFVESTGIRNSSIISPVYKNHHHHGKK